MTRRRASSNGPASRRRRARIYTRRRSLPGSAPGTLRAQPDAPKPRIHVMCYGDAGVEESDIAEPAQLESWLGREGVVWVNVDGLGDTAVLQQIGDLLDAHRLIMEDVVNVHQRPKVEVYGEQLFVVTRMPGTNGVQRDEQVSLIVSRGLVVSFQETIGDCLDPVRRRIREGMGRIRGREADYLAYAVIDAIVDAYFPLLEAWGERLEDLEDEAVHRASSGTITRIHDAKRELLLLRRVVWPMREMVNGLMRESTPVVTESTRVYLRDCYDHIVQVIDIVENYREVASGLMDVHLSVVSNRMNEVMKVLTVMATMFIPLTFIAGIYGMNFNPETSPWNMPELNWYLGYPFCIALMAATCIGLLLYFRRLGWIGGGGGEDDDAGR